ncbi:hypothetical protein LVJ94_30825 [Pendulispora rubella]|uniref:Exo-alpha-sialidase n=1 Tax=Pendulispora rubella TaxID=2741070 RepID=A0ABZ2KTB4_9BACT
MLLDPRGRLVVASTLAQRLPDYEYKMDVLVQRWSGTGWAPLGSLIPDREGPVLALDANSKPFVACAQRLHGETVTFNVMVYSFDGKDTWSPLGGPVNDSPTDRLNPYLVVDHTGVPHVTYTDPLPQIRKWTGSRWVEVNANPWINGAYLRWLEIAFDDSGRLFGLGGFSDDTVRVLMFNGSDWVPVGDSFGNQIPAHTLVAGHDGHLFAIVYEGPYDESFRVADITAAGWTKSDWPVEGFGGPLAVDPDNVPVVVSSKFGVLRPNR